MGVLDYVLIVIGGYCSLGLLIAAYDETIHSSQVADIKHYHPGEYEKRQTVKGRYLLTLLVCVFFFLLRLKEHG